MIYDNLKPYINEDGFLTVQPNAQTIPGEGNGWLQLGVAIALIGFEGYPFPLKTNSLIDRCRRTPMQPLIYPSPHKKNADDVEKCDDYWAVLMLAGLIKSSWPSELLNWAEENNWFFNVQDPLSKDLNYRFDRFPAFAPMLRLCAGQQLSIVDSAILAFTIVWDAFSIGAADGNMRSFCKIIMAEKSGVLPAMASMLWIYRIEKRYGSIAMSFEAYFGKGHPITLVKV